MMDLLVTRCNYLQNARNVRTGSRLQSFCLCGFQKRRKISRLAERLLVTLVWSR